MPTENQEREKKMYKIFNTTTGELLAEAEILLDATEVAREIAAQGIAVKVVNMKDVMPQPKKEKAVKKTIPPAAALVKRELLSPETQEWLRNILENEIAPLLQADVSNYAPGRMRTWMPYEAPLDSQKSMDRPFTPGVLHPELWQFIVDLCAKHGMKAQTCLISKGGNIKPHRDTTYADAWAMGINLGVCDWHIASNRDSAKTDYSMSLSGGEVFSFNSKHVHAVTDAAPDRWAINVWAIANTNAAKNAQVHERLAKMLEENPQVAEFIDRHQPGADRNVPKEEPIMREKPTCQNTYTESSDDYPFYSFYYDNWEADEEKMTKAFEDGLRWGYIVKQDEFYSFDAFDFSGLLDFRRQLSVTASRKMKEYFSHVASCEHQECGICEAGCGCQTCNWCKQNGGNDLVPDNPTPVQSEQEETVIEQPENTQQKEEPPMVAPNKPQRKKGDHIMNKVREYVISFMLNDEPTTGRIITNDPEYWLNRDGTVVIEEADKGHYNFALAEYLFRGESFAINVTPFVWERIAQLGFTSTPMEDDPNEKDPEIIFGWSNFDSETVIRIKGHSSKDYEDMSKFGLLVGNSDKMVKRLVELSKPVSGYLFNEDKMKLRIKVLSHADLLRAFPKTKNKNIMDGISLGAVEKVKYIYRSNPHMSKKSKSKILRGIESKKITNFTVRILTNIDGNGALIKGNMLVAERKVMMNRLRELGLIGKGEVYDIVTSEDNVKFELGTDGSFEFMSLEAHHGVGIVKTNDQMLGQYCGIPGMFDPKELLATFQVALDKMYNDLVEGRDITMLENLTPERPDGEEGYIRSLTKSGATNVINTMAATLKDLGLPINVSQTLMFMRANFVKRMFLSEHIDTLGEGNNWMADSKEKKAFLYQPWSYSAYIMPKEVIYMLGYDVDLDDMEGVYHEETQTFMIPGCLAKPIMAKLGGGDFDDNVMIHIRRMVMMDGSIRLVAVLIRTPNDWGEFWILDVSEFGPVFFADDDGIDLPTIYEKDFLKFNTVAPAGQLPSKMNGSNRPKPAVWDWESTVYNAKAALVSGSGVGGQVKAKMIQYGAFNAPFNWLVCPNEDMIDALQQCKGDMEDLAALNEWSILEMARILQTAHLDAYWWESRNMSNTAFILRKKRLISSALKPLEDYESPIVTELMSPREEMVHATYKKMVGFLNVNIHEVPELAKIFYSEKEKVGYRGVIKQFHDMFLEANRGTKEERTIEYRNVANQIMERTQKNKAKMTPEQFHLSILKLFRISWEYKQYGLERGWTKADIKNYDKWLFTADPQAENLMVDYFHDALVWFRSQDNS